MVSKLTPRPKPTKVKKKKRGKYISPRKRIEIQLDKVFSEYIKLRDDRKCVICGTDKLPQCGHLITRSCSRLRWDPRNAACQCAGHNLQHEYRPEIFTTWFIQTRGLETYNELYQLSQLQNFKWEIEELKSILLELQSKLIGLKERSLYAEKPGRYKSI
jgi:hypothetical protein